MQFVTAPFGKTMDNFEFDIRNDLALAEALHGALLDLKEEVAEERDQAVETMAGWAGVRRSTMYDWLEGKYPPKKWEQLVRLSLNSTRDGFTSFGRFLIWANVRFSSLGEVTTDGNLNREKRESDRVWAELWSAEEANDGDRIQELGQALHHIADSIIEEGRRKRAERLRKVG